MSLLRDVMHQRRLLHGDGSHAVVVPASGRVTTAPGVWHVEGEHCFVLFDPPVALQEGVAHLRVDLDAGVFRFTGWVRPIDGRRCEVWMHRTVDVEENRGATRVPVQIQGSVTASAGSAEIAVTVRNISARGVAFDSPTELPPGGSYRLHLSGSVGERLDVLPIEVVRCTRREGGWSCGCRLQIGAGVQERLYALLRDMRTRSDALSGVPAPTVQTN